MLGELNPEQVEAVLREATVARIGCHAGGTTYVVPVTYAYDGGALIGHSAEGMKVRMMCENPAVCVEVERVDDLANWRGVIAWGRCEELAGAEAEAAMGTLVARLVPLVASETARPSHGLGAAQRADTAGRHAIVYRIRLDRETGRGGMAALYGVLGVPPAGTVLVVLSYRLLSFRVPISPGFPSPSSSTTSGAEPFPTGAPGVRRSGPGTGNRGGAYAPGSVPLTTAPERIG